jgi:hypothetical protein
MILPKSCQDDPIDSSEQRQGPVSTKRSGSSSHGVGDQGDPDRRNGGAAAGDF